VKESKVLDAVAVGLADAQVPINYHAELHDFSQRLSDQPAWLIALRREGYTQFGSAGFPTTHDEDWRFTNVSEVAKTRFTLAPPAQPVRAQDLEEFGASAFACQLVFVNGRFAPELSRVPAMPAGVRVGSLAEEIAVNPRSVEPHLGHYLNFRRDAFCALNTAFIERVNLTVRHGIAALARRTWATSQQSPHLHAHLEWWRAYYHFVRPHQSLRVKLVQPRERGGKLLAQRYRQRTPAMAAGRTHRRWTAREVLSYPLPPVSD